MLSKADDSLAERTIADIKNMYEGKLVKRVESYIEGPKQSVQSANSRGTHLGA